MMIPDDKVEEVKSATDIVDVVSDYVRLKKAGSNFKGLCPFHNEKTPSFNVNPGMGIFKCFGCGEGGDAISFVMKIEGTGFTETVRMLADQAGIELPAEGRQDPHSDEKESVLHALRFAARYYYEQLTQSDVGRERGLGYFENRGLTPETIKKFGLGFAPDAWDGLLKAAEQQQIKPEILDKAGLVLPNKSGSGYHDRFRERVMFPIFSHVGKVLGFGGRVLPDSKPAGGDYVPPKYINSPETRVYRKSRVLYGLYQGKQAIRAAEEAILVEGYTDVIALHQAGVENVVGVCGTSLTEGHLRSLSRYCERIILLNDGDPAGEKATLRGIEQCLKAGFDVLMVNLPEGADPDSFASLIGAEEMRKYCRDYGDNFVKYMVRMARNRGELDTAEGNRNVAQQILEVIAVLQSAVSREFFVRDLAQELKVPDTVLYRELKSANMPNKSRNSRRTPPPRRHDVVGGRAEAPQRLSPQREAPPPPEEEHPAAPAPETFEMKPEEGALLRLMLEQGSPMVEHVLGHMALEEFSSGPVRETVRQLLAQYQGGSVEREAFVEGAFGPAVQQIAAGVLVDRHVASENYARKGIRVPEMNAEPFEAAASAMTLLKLDRVNEAIALQGRKVYAAEQADEDLTPHLEAMQQLQRLKVQIERREFFEWGKDE